MTIFGASIGVIMCFFRQTLLSVCLILPCVVYGQLVAGNDDATTPEDINAVFNITANDDDPTFGIDPASIDLDPSSVATEEKNITTAEGEFTVDLTGEITFDPNQDFFGDAIITYTIKNLEATPQTSSEATITVTVTSVNDLPTISTITDQVIDEDNSTGILAFTIGDVETIPGSLILSVASDNTALVPDINIVLTGSDANREVQITPLADASGTANITITVGDGDDEIDMTFQVVVNAVNDDPTITSIADQVINQDSQTGMLAFTVGDVETALSSLTVTGVSNNLTLVPDLAISIAGSAPNKTVQVSPAAGQSGIATITLRVDDGSSFTETSFDVTVTPAGNNPPTITSITDQTIDQDSQTGLLPFTVSDVETTPSSLIVTGVSNNLALVPDLAIDIDGVGPDKTVQVSPAAGQSGVATITLRVSDGDDFTETSFDVTVTPAGNNPPTITPIASQTIDQDSQTALLPFTVSDVETAPSLLSVTGVSNNLALVPNIDIDIVGTGSNKTVQVSPAAGQSGIATITLRVSDGDDFAETSFDVTVTPAVNNPPTITSIDDQIIDEDNSTSGLSFTIGDVETAVGALIVARSSDNPTLIPDANILLSGTGPVRTVTVTPASNLSGTADITITVDDTQAQSQTTFTVTVNAVNDAPVFSEGADQNDTEDAGPKTVSSWATGIGDGDPELSQALTFDVSNGNNGLFSVQPAISEAGALTYTPAANANGAAIVTVSLSDDGSGVAPNVNTTADQTFTITVTAVNDAPFFTIGLDQAIDENAGAQSVAGWATGIGDGDPEVSQTLTFNVSNDNNALFSVQPAITAGGTLSFTPAAGANGSAVVTVTLSDNGSGVAPNVNTSPQQTFNITVTPVNDPPTITSIADQTIPEDSQTGPLNFTIGDAETPATMLTLIPTSSNLGLVPNSQVLLGGAGSLRNVNVIPNINQIGQTTITLEVSDGLLSSITSFNVLVTALDDPPTITPIGDQVINEDAQTGLIAFTVGDLETDPSLITVTGSSDNQTLVQDSDIDLQGFGGPNWTVQVTPNPNQNGNATITLSVFDGTETTLLDFEVTVNAVNDVPVFAGGPDQTEEEDAGPQSVSNWATGISDGDPELDQALTFDVTNTNNGLFSVQPAISATGTLTYTPAPNTNGSSIVTVSLADNGSGAAPNVNTSADQTFTINITAVNDAPVFTKGADQTLSENAGAQSVPGWATGIGDGDPEVSQTLTFSVSNDNNSLFSVQPAITAGGTLNFTPAPGSNGSAVVTVSISDNGSGVAPNVNTSPQQTFNITVDPINDAPFFTKGADQTDNEDAGAQSISNWATGIEDGDPDVVQSLTFNVSNNNNALFSVQPTISAAGTLTYTPAANANGSTVVTVSLSDSGSDVPPNVNTSAAQTFNITIDAVNDAPVFVGGSGVTVSENAGPQSVPGWATGISDGDPEVSQTLSFNVSNDNNGLFSAQPVISAGGNLSFTPAAGVSGTATVTVSLSDNGSAAAPNVNTSGPQNFTITVTQINDAPVFTKGPNQTIGEDAGPQTVNGWATGISDGDPDQTQALTFNVTNDDNTLFSTQPAITPAGNLSYTPAANAAGSTIVTVTLSDDGPGSPPDVNTSGPQTFTILINQANDAPTVSVIGNQTINEDGQTGNLGFTISDPETAATDLIVTATSDNTTLIPNSVANIVLGGAGPSRTINIIPVVNLSGSATITINVSDGTLSTNRNFLVTVTSVNDAPTITAIGDQTVTEDTPTGSLAFTIGDTETPVGSLTLSTSSSNTILVPVSNIALGGSGASRTVIVTPAPDQTGTTTITITVDDGTSSTSEDFVVNVTPINDPPTISAISDRTINEDTQTGNINFTISDPETAATSLIVTGASSNTTLVPNANIILGGTGTARTVNIIPVANQNGATTITLNVSDGLNSTPVVFQVNVTPVNDGPQITNQIPVTINEGESVTLTVAMLTILDPDNVFPTDFTLAVTGGTGYSVQGASTITPNVNVSGVLSVPVYVSDGAAISPIYQFQITVNSTNDAPEITAQKTLTIQEDQSYSIQFDDLTVDDPDDIYPTDFTLEILPGTNYTFTGTTISPVLNFNGSLSVNVRVNDGQANSNTFPLVVTVTPINDPPVITNQSSLSTNEETPLTLVVGNFTISDPEPTTHILTVLPSASPDYTVTGNQITPRLDFTGILSVPVTVSDGALISAQYDAQITVNPVNDPPVILNLIGSLSTIEDTPIVLALSDLNVSDVDNTYPTGFTLIVEAGTNYTFSGTTVTPTLDFVGTIDVVVSVNDGGANSPQFLVQIQVTDDADAPVINGQNPVSLDEDTSREITLDDLVWEDPDTQESQLTLIVQPGTNYTLEGNFVVPLPNFYGTLTVPVMINDGEANSNVFPLQVTVISIPDAPSFIPPVNVTIQEDAAQQTRTITAISPGPLESQMLLFATPISSNPDLIPNPVIPAYNGTAPTATVVFKPEPNMYGSATITLKVVDTDFLEYETIFTITVNPVNDSPTLTAIPPLTVNEDAVDQLISLSGISPGGGPPESSQTLEQFVSVDNADLFDEVPNVEIVGSSGTLRFKLKPNANGAAQITVKLQDNGTPAPASITRVFTLTITPSNDLPEFTTMAPTTAEPGILYTYNVEVTDVDGEAITLTAPTKPTWLNFVNGTNGKATLSGTPPLGPGGDVEVLLEAKDPTGTPVLQPITISVNSRPVLEPIVVSIVEDESYTFKGSDFSAGFSDAEGNPLAELEITELPQNGTLTYDGNPVAVGAKIPAADISKLRYTPTSNFIGNDTFRWNAGDGFIFSTTDTDATITVTPVNDAPIVRIPEAHDPNTDTLKYELGSEIPVFVTTQFEVSDPDGDNIASAVVRIEGVTYRPENEVLTFVPTANVSGSFNDNSGVLTLTGSATAAEYVEVIRSVKYNYINTRELILDTRSVSVTMFDGQVNSNTDARPIELIYTFSDLDIPNAFSPNGDEANESWRITSANGTAQYDDAQVRVYNKRGLLLFETKGFERQWDGVWNGEVLPSDTYFYTIELNYNKVRYKGTVTILR
jgi:gliding motility-associated-like protein